MQIVDDNTTQPSKYTGTCCRLDIRWFARTVYETLAAENKLQTTWQISGSTCLMCFFKRTILSNKWQSLRTLFWWSMCPWTVVNPTDRHIRPNFSSLIVGAHETGRPRKLSDNMTHLKRKQWTSTPGELGKYHSATYNKRWCYRHLSLRLETAHLRCAKILASRDCYLCCSVEVFDAVWEKHHNFFLGSFSSCIQITL